MSALKPQVEDPAKTFPRSKALYRYMDAAGGGIMEEPKGPRTLQQESSGALAVPAGPEP
jgi:hypothetical protein